ncbi:MAG: hypothetical protein ACQEQV_03455 [Fibrobacterota bacterium]
MNGIVSTLLLLLFFAALPAEETFVREITALTRSAGAASQCTVQTASAGAYTFSDRDSLSRIWIDLSIARDENLSVTIITDSWVSPRVVQSVRFADSASYKAARDTSSLAARRRRRQESFITSPYSANASVRTSGVQKNDQNGRGRMERTRSTITISSDRGRKDQQEKLNER